MQIIIHCIFRLLIPLNSCYKDDFAFFIELPLMTVDWDCWSDGVLVLTLFLTVILRSVVTFDDYANIEIVFIKRTDSAASKQVYMTLRN